MTAMPWWAPWVGAGVLIATAFWWWVPKWQANRLSLKIRDPKARADVEDNFRKTIGQLLGGAAVLVGTGFAYYQSQLAQQATHDQLKAAYDQIISQQVAKGFEQLGSKDNVVLRLGGIYSLEGVMNTSEQYHKPVLEALCAFVRDGAKAKSDKDKPKESEAPATDIQAALTVIGRRKDRPGLVDLSGANLIGASLTHADLNRANLSRAALLSASLIGAHPSGANLTGADLRGASLIGANLSDATGLSHDQLDKACGDKDTKLPSGLMIKPCWQRRWPHSRRRAPAWFGTEPLSATQKTTRGKLQ
jgi:hypothetical protein